MPLLDYLSADGVMIGMSATSKKQLIEKIADHAAALTGLSARAIFDALIQRERLGSTGIGGGIALPHAVFAEMPKSIVLVTILDKPVDFDARDKKPVDVICTILGPEQADCDHLKLLSKAAKILVDQGVCGALRSATTAAQIQQCFGQPQATAA